MNDNNHKNGPLGRKSGGSVTTQKKRQCVVMPAVVACLGLAALGGCALPGYDAGSFTDHWYSFGDDKASTYEDNLSHQRKIDYEPSVMQITPGLISHLKRVKSQETLPQDVKALTAGRVSGNYEVGVGDILQVVVFGHPELTNPGGGNGGNNGGGNSRQSGQVDTSGQLVNAQGEIYFPYVGQIQAANRTLTEIRQSIRDGLSEYIRQPQVDVRVRQYRSQRVYISGDIDRPCTVPITDIDLTVVQALDACSSLSSKQGGGTGVRNIRLIRNQQSTLIDLNQVYAEGLDIPLQSSDRLLVDDTANRVFMVGEFDQQTSLPYAVGGLSLSDALATVGGVDLATADTSKIAVIRGFVNGHDFDQGGVQTSTHPKIYTLDMSTPTGLLLANQFRLQPRDVVFAPPASFVNFNRALALILPSINAITSSYLLYDRVGN